MSKINYICEDMKILGIGEIVWDCLPGGRKLGGAPVNFAYYAKELGALSYPVSAVGNDELGDETLEACRSYGLCTDYIQRNDLPTSRVLVSVDAAGIPQYEIVRNVAWDAVEASSEALELAGEADCICWGSLAQRDVKSREAILSLLDNAPESCLKVFDINLRQKFYSGEVVEGSLSRADVLKLNEDELPVVLDLAGCVDIAGLIKKYALMYVVYTCGASYSEVYSEKGLESHIDTPKVDVVDTVGAGDSFTATFITCLLKGGSVVECHRKAVEVSAYVCTRAGAIIKGSL